MTDDRVDAAAETRLGFDEALGVLHGWLGRVVRVHVSARAGGQNLAVLRGPLHCGRPVPLLQRHPLYEVLIFDVGDEPSSTESAHGFLFPVEGFGSATSDGVHLNIEFVHARIVVQLDEATASP